MIAFKLDDGTPVQIHAIRLGGTPITIAAVVIGDPAKGKQNTIVVGGKTFKHPNDKDSDIAAVKAAVRNALEIGLPDWFTSSENRTRMYDQVWHKFREYLYHDQCARSTLDLMEGAKRVVEFHIDSTKGMQ